ncbi:MAG: toxin co-regulated pilus biosynthesis Q family protein [Burkholderiaceae bacterium]|nr:toxin co-regulated pilus biosynthesis Q family protein [Burkholderiaceae bacterium]
MKMNKLVVAMALILGAGSSYAGFVDNRAADGVVDVNYKSVAVEDLVADIVPPGYQAEYTKPVHRKALVNITGKGIWHTLLTDAVARSNLLVNIDQEKRTIKFSDLLAPAERAPELAAAASTTAPTSTTTAAIEATIQTSTAARKSSVLKVQGPVETPAPASYTTTSADYQVSAVLQRWAGQANMQYVWEPRNVEFQISAENDWGTDLRRAVRGLLTSVQMNQRSQAGRERVRACIHPNKPKNVLRIIRFEERCQGDM